MKKYYKKIYNISNVKKNNIKSVIKNRYNVLSFVIILMFAVLFVFLFNTSILNGEYYINKLSSLTRNIVYSNSTPRGRIYDRNGNIIVDNEAVKVIYYKNESNTREEEIEIAYKVAEMIELDYSKLSLSDLKLFWIYTNEDIANSLITEEEIVLLEERKITYDDILELKISRISDSDINELTETDYLAAYLYTLMNNGYSYDDKIIKKENVTEEEYAVIAENLSSLPGFGVRLDWIRVYPYGDLFKTILGTVSTTETGLPYELKDYYLNLGYELDDRVGTSYLEYQYESLLKGDKVVYEILDDGSKKIIDEGSRGKDIVLTIDINLQKEVEKIIEEELIKAQNDPNTLVFDTSFVIISDPVTGEILAMAGKKIDKETYEIYDYTTGIINHSVTIGSAVKGASHIVGYNNGAIEIGEVRSDNCIKIAATPEKCSWTSLGYMNDLTALKYSSNVYQYKTAINVGEGYYSYDKSLPINIEAFDIYRETFSEFGLGVLTGIDLPNESIGYQGNSTLPGHLLDFSIGQYDNYTPIQLSQYINTIANDGYRVKPTLLKAVYEPSKDSLSNLLYEQEATVLNKLDTEELYLKRVQEGFKEVMTTSGTGVYHINSEYNAAGKTGTGEGFLDTDSDGMIDKATVSKSFVAYAPYDNPEVSFTVISPHIYTDLGRGEAITLVNQYISYRISEKYFELY